MTKTISHFQYMIITPDVSGSRFYYGNGHFWEAEDPLVMGWWWAESPKSAIKLARKELIEKSQWPDKLVDEMPLEAFELASVEEKKPSRISAPRKSRGISSYLILVDNTRDTTIGLSDGDVKKFSGATEVGVYEARSQAEALYLVQLDFRKWGFALSEIDVLSFSVYELKSKR